MTKTYKDIDGAKRSSRQDPAVSPRPRSSTPSWARKPKNHEPAPYLPCEDRPKFHAPIAGDPQREDIPGALEALGTEDDNLSGEAGTCLSCGRFREILESGECVECFEAGDDEVLGEILRLHGEVGQ